MTRPSNPVCTESIDRLLALLTAFHGSGVHNQYRDAEADLDRPDGAAVRRRNLRRYLEAFSRASHVLVGEAAGYAGCRFSGIPFTGEAQIVGPDCLPWARRLGFEQSSKGEVWRERSGQMVWQAFDGRRDCVLWNTFPWHPFGAKRLSNRKPRRTEIEGATGVLTLFLSLFPGADVYAVGRVSQDALARLGITAVYIRHPSHGGKPEFLRGVQSIPHGDSLPRT